MGVCVCDSCAPLSTLPSCKCACVRKTSTWPHVMQHFLRAILWAIALWQSMLGNCQATVQSNRWHDMRLVSHSLDLLGIIGQVGTTRASNKSLRPFVADRSALPIAKHEQRFLFCLLFHCFLVFRFAVFPALHGQGLLVHARRLTHAT